MPLLTCLRVSERPIAPKPRMSETITLAVGWSDCSYGGDCYPYRPEGVKWALIVTLIN